MPDPAVAARTTDIHARTELYIEPALMIHVRTAVPADLDRICQFNQSLALETETRSIPAHVLRAGVEAALVSADKLRYWVAVSLDDPDLPVGQVAVSYEWSDWRNGWIWWLQSVYVDANWRGRGVFRSLLEQVKADAQADGQVIGLRLYMEHDNHAARATYEKMGFTPAGYEVLEAMWADQTVRE